MSRLTLAVAAFVSAAAGLLTGVFLTLKLHTPLPSLSPTVVDFVRIIDRQREEVLKSAKDPEAADRMMKQRLGWMDEMIVELSQGSVVWNKAAIVRGEVHDITKEVEALLRERESAS